MTFTGFVDRIKETFFTLPPLEGDYAQNEASWARLEAYNIWMTDKRLKHADPRTLWYHEAQHSMRKPTLIPYERLSAKQQQYYVTQAARNAELNAIQFARRNARVPLNTDVEHLSGPNCSEHGMSRSGRQGLQKWNRYRRDHPKACGGEIFQDGTSTKPVPETPFPFMNLPYELRQKVYESLLTQEGQLLQQPANCSTTCEGFIADVRIFTVSRFVYEEALRVFYRVNRFIINVGEQPLMVEQNTGNEAPRPTNLIERVHLEFFSETWVDGIHTWHPGWERVHDLLKGCSNLHEIDITTVRHFSDYSSPIIASLAGVRHNLGVES